MKKFLSSIDIPLSLCYNTLMDTKLYEIQSEYQGYFYFRKGATHLVTAPHFHSSIEMLFCMGGEQELTIAGEKKVLRKGDACFINSYVVHSMQKSDGNNFLFLGDLKFFQPVFHSFGEKRPPRFFRFEDENLLNTLYNLCEKHKDTAYSNESLETFEGVIKILLASVSLQVPFEKQKEHRQTDLVASILQYASEHITSDLSLTALADKFGYSHEHLSRILHHRLGEHWSRYIGRLRAREAHQLLKSNPSLSVLEIATKCGFDSPNTFYRAYQREFGKTPRM